MNVVAGGGNTMGGQQHPQQQQQSVAGPPRYMPVNGTTMDPTSLTSPRRTNVLPLANILSAKGYTQIQFNAVTEQEYQRQMDEYNKTVTIVLWYKAKMEPLRIQHTIRSFPFFQLSGLAPIVNGLGLADDSYLDTYIPENGYWMQHTIHTVRIVESQQRLLYRIRKNLLEGINEDDCMNLLAEVDMQQQLISSKKQVTVSQPGPSLDVGLPTPITPARSSSSIKEVSEKSPRKRLASEVHSAQEFEQGRPPTTKVHIPNNYYLASHNETAGPDVSTTSTPVLPPETVVDDHATSAAGDVDPVNVNHGVTSTASEYLYQNQVYYSPTSPDNTLSSSNHTETPISGNDTSNGAVTYHTHLSHPHLPLKRWPNDYSVAEISSGFHEMDRVVAQTPNMTQRVAFERVFGSRYVKSTVCRHRGVWKRASPALRDQFIALGNDERVLWGEFVRTVEGRQTAKAPGSRIIAAVQPSSHEAIGFSAEAGTEGELVDVGGGSDGLQGQGVPVPGHESGSGAVEQPIMDSLQNPSVSGPSSATSSLQNELNVYDTSRSHISSSQT